MAVQILMYTNMHISFFLLAVHDQMFILHFLFAVTLCIHCSFCDLMHIFFFLSVVPLVHYYFDPCWNLNCLVHSNTYDFLCIRSHSSFIPYCIYILYYSRKELSCWHSFVYCLHIVNFMQFYLSLFSNSVGSKLYYCFVKRTRHILIVGHVYKWLWVYVVIFLYFDHF